MNQAQAIEEAKKIGLKWVAMDADGAWWGYEAEPLSRENSFDRLGGECSFLGTFDTGWRDSLADVK